MSYKLERAMIHEKSYYINMTFFPEDDWVKIILESAMIHFFLKVTYLNTGMTLIPEYDIIWLCCTGPSKSKSFAGIYLHSLYISTYVCIGNLRRPLFNKTRQNWLRRISTSKRHYAFWIDFIIIARLNKTYKTNFTYKKNNG